MSRTALTRLATATALAAVAAGLVVVLLPRAASVPWGEIAAALSALSVGPAVVVTAVWFAGLCMNTVAMTAALPGLTHRRALALNLTGSAVANVLPLGGAAGIGLNFAMARSWGIRARAFSSFTMLTNICTTLAKLALPFLALALLVLRGHVPDQRVTVSTLVSGVLLAGLVVATAGLFSERVTRAVGRALQPGVHALLRLVRSHRSPDLVGALLDVRRQTAVLVVNGWRRLVFGTLGYFGLQAALLWLILNLLGSGLGPAEIFAGYALERLLTLAAITPGGAGIVELGMTALLVRLGGDPAATAAGVLLYRGFTFGLEIPVGGAWLLAWFGRHRRRLARRVAVSEPG